MRILTKILNNEGIDISELKNLFHSPDIYYVRQLGLIYNKFEYDKESSEPWQPKNNRWYVTKYGRIIIFDLYQKNFQFIDSYPKTWKENHSKKTLQPRKRYRFEVVS